MRLIDLQPLWLFKGSVRVGFAFRSPTKREFWQTCLVEPMPRREQWALHVANGFDEDRQMVQGCNPEHRWTIAGGIDNATFETISVTPSLDGSPGGLWHGHITNGEIVGGN